MSQTIQVKTFLYRPSLSFVTKLRPAANFPAKISPMRRTYALEFDMPVVHKMRNLNTSYANKPLKI